MVMMEGNRKELDHTQLCTGQDLLLVELHINLGGRKGAREDFYLFHYLSTSMTILKKISPVNLKLLCLI